MCKSFYFAGSSASQRGVFMTYDKAWFKTKTRLFSMESTNVNNTFRGNTWKQRLFRYNENIDDDINNNNNHSKHLEGAKHYLRNYAYTILIHRTVGSKLLTNKESEKEVK